jgi:hypothetical protein
MEDVTELARTALLEVTPESTVGQQVGTVDEGDGVVSVLFANRMPGYPGWRWTVSVAQVEGDEPTVLEVELMPGDGSLVAPEWVPWADRMAEYRAGQDDEGDDDESDDDESDDDEGDDDEDADEEADYEDPDDDEADDDASDDDDDADDDEFDDDEDDLGESDDDELDGVDVDAAAEQDDAEQDEDDTADEETVPTRSRGARRRASRVRPTDPDEDLEVDRLDPGETDPERHGA